MATAAEADEHAYCGRARSRSRSPSQLRRLARVATFVAILDEPGRLLLVPPRQPSGRRRVDRRARSLVVVGFRGLVDLIIRRLIPWPSLFGTDDARLREEDIVNRRRAWTWRFWFRVGDLLRRDHHARLPDSSVTAPAGIASLARAPAAHVLDEIGTLAHSRRASGCRSSSSFFLFLANFLIFMGPMLLMGISQIRGYEPGDAEWGVKLERRPRPGRGEGGGAPRRHALAVGRGVRAGRRQARARPALPRRAGHRQDDAREGDRDRLQLAVRLDPGLRLRADVHRHRRAHRALPRAQGEEARAQVGRPVHRLHRRDRRRRHAPAGAAGRQRCSRSPESSPAVLRAVRRAQPERRPDLRERAPGASTVQPARARAPLAVSGAGCTSSATSSTRASSPG